MYEEQKVAVFVDVQNMYYSSKNLYNTKVNFKNLLKIVLRGRRLIRAFAYAVRASIPEEENFFEALRKVGFEVKVKDLKVYYGGAKKGDWDMGIAIDAIKMAPKVDVIVIVSGDGDFYPLIEHLKALGVKVEVCAFGRSAAKEIKEGADEFIDMDSNPEDFLI
jgi:uncharacterized LabA/DUF88 family protein